jgi:hypothetical protein
VELVVTGFTENDDEVRLGRPEMLSVTLLLLPIAVTLTVTVALDFRRTVMVEGALMLKSPASAFTVSEQCVHPHDL